MKCPLVHLRGVPHLQHMCSRDNCLIGFCAMRIEKKRKEKERLKIEEPQFKVSLRPTFLQKLCLAPFFSMLCFMQVNEV